MPRIHSLKKRNPPDSIWPHYPKDDFVRPVRISKEVAGKGTAREILPCSKDIVPQEMESVFFQSLVKKNGFQSCS